MPIWDEQSLDKVIASAILGALGAAISFFLSKSKEPGVKAKHFFGGLLFGIALSLILNEYEGATSFKFIVVFCGGAFVPTLWPILERMSAKYTQNKINPTKDEPE